MYFSVLSFVNLLSIIEYSKYTTLSQNNIYKLFESLGKKKRKQREGEIDRPQNIV